MRSGAASARILAIALAAGAAAAAHAQLAQAPESFAIAIEHGKPELGAGWDSEQAAARAEPGACVEDLGTERTEERAVRYSLVTLTRAGGRLLVGVHVSTTTAAHTLSSPRLTDAARRLAQAKPAEFRALCGDGYVARIELGGHWLGEIEIEREDVSQASTVLVTGSWTDPAPLRAALERLSKYRTRARELPGGSRAAAIELGLEALAERAARFPERVSAASAEPFLAVFAAYSQQSLAGVGLPGAGEVEGREIAARMFRRDRETAMSSAAYRAAEMRKAQVRRYEPDASESAAPIERSNDSLPPAFSPRPAASAPAAALAPPAALRESSPRASAPSLSVQVHRQAAFVYETPGAPVVYATTRAPRGVHAERQRERFYWVPGAPAATAENERAMRAAMAGTPVRGVTITIVEVGPTVVVMTDAPPPGDVFSVAAGERRAWIAGVAQPDEAQRAALLEAVRAERAGESGRR